MNTAPRAQPSNGRDAPRAPAPPPRRVTTRPPPLSSTVSGVYARPLLEDDRANRDDMADFEALVRRASTPPPRRSDELDDMDDMLAVGVLPLLPPPGFHSVRPPLESYVAELREREEVVTEKHETWKAKATIALPWTLLFLGAIGVAGGWFSRSDVAQAVVADSTSAASADVELGGTVAAEPNSDVATVASRESARRRSERARSSDGHRVRTRDEVRGARNEPAAPQEVAAASPSPSPSPSPSEAAAPPPRAAEPAAESTSNASIRMNQIIAHVERGQADAPTPSQTESNAPSVPAAAATPIERPSRADVVSALRRVAGAVDACTAETGSVTVHLIVAPNGSVSSAQATGRFAGTPEGACIVNAVRRARFPAFTSSSMPIDFPFSLH